MYDRSELGYLIRKIKRTYKWYTGERTDGTATILDLANLFKLSIDEDKLEDYEVKSIKFDNPMIEIISKSTGYIYHAEYSAGSDLLSYHSCELKFINQVIQYSDTMKREITRSILWDDIYYDRFYIMINDHQTVRINRFGPNPYSTFSPRFTQTSISLSDTNSRHTGQIDYSIRSPKSDTYEFEMETRGWAEEYQYKLNNGLIYSLERDSERIHAVIFVENVFKGIDKYLPLNFHIESNVKSENETLTNDQVYSVIDLYGLSHTRIHIYKECRNFKVKYRTRKSWDGPEEKFEYVIPVLNSCSPIDYIECEYLANELGKYIKNEEMVRLVQEKLHEIKFRLMISKGLANKEETVLTIQKYRDLPFDDAIKLFVENKDEILKEIFKRIGEKE